MHTQTYLAYVQKPGGPRKKSKKSKSRESRGGSRDQKFRSGEQSLAAANQSVTHNNIITANNVIINYGGSAGDNNPQPVASSSNKLKTAEKEPPAG